MSVFSGAVLFEQTDVCPGAVRDYRNKVREPAAVSEGLLQVISKRLAGIVAGPSETGCRVTKAVIKDREEVIGAGEG